MNVILFLSVLAVSFIVVRIGAIAFQLTGLEWELAKFQALSCFSGTGFTTREAELVVSNPQRRRVATILIVLGNAGLVTMVATFANSLRPQTAGTRIPLPFFKDVPSYLLHWISLVIIIILIFATYKIFTHTRLLQKLTELLRKQLIRQELIKPVTFEELLMSTGGYGVSRITICGGSPIHNKTLTESRLRSYDITVLAVIRNERTIPNPPADMKLISGDELICFGKLENIREQICTPQTQSNGTGDSCQNEQNS